MAKTNQWKTNGDEDEFIIKQIKEGKVNKFTKPGMLKKNHPGLFGDYSDNVIRNHLNHLKRMNGLYIDGQKSDDEDSQPNDLETNNTDKVATLSPNGISINHANYPFLCETYKNPDNQMDMVVIVVSIPGGAQNVKVSLNEEGTKATLKYGWPKVAFDIDNLFKKQIDANQITTHHPKLLSLKGGLEKVRSRIDTIPVTTVEINLPITVQTSVDSIKKYGIARADGSQSLVIECTGYVKIYNKTSADEAVIFEL